MAAAIACAVALTVGVASTSSGHKRVRDTLVKNCALPDVNSPRDPRNPLALPTRPAGTDPLTGAHFFVDGPRHGQAAGAIAQSLGLDPMTFPNNYSWTQFVQTFGSRFTPNDTLLAKIAGQEETQNISLFAQGGGPGAIYSQTVKLLCYNAAADPNPFTVPVLSTFFIYPHGQFCPTARELDQWQSTFRRDVNEMAWAVGNKRAVILEEIDSIGASGCLERTPLTQWLRDLRYEAKRFSKLPHAVVYAEAGYSDANSPRFTANRLRRAGATLNAGFFTDDTHFAWSTKEIDWAQKVAEILYGDSHHTYPAHFVVNTAQNGRGPLLNPHPVTQGIENLCNPPGRGLGRLPTGNVQPTFDNHRFKYLDGFLWTGVPGRSHNSDCPNGPWQSAGVFDLRFALELAKNADQKLGPGFPSQPY